MISIDIFWLLVYLTSKCLPRLQPPLKLITGGVESPYLKFYKLRPCLRCDKWVIVLSWGTISLKTGVRLHTSDPPRPVIPNTASA